MDAGSSPSPRARGAQAIRNDERILESAHAVFVANPGAPIAAVAEHAGVGISALYRRYPSKEYLLQRLGAEGLHRYIAAAEDALAGADAWSAFEGFMHEVMDADTHALTQRLAGTFTPTEELGTLAERAHELAVLLVDRARTAGLRDDVVVDDLSYVLEQLAAVRGHDHQRTRELRRRYLALQLDAMHATSARPLPGPPPDWDEVAARWDT